MPSSLRPLAPRGSPSHLSTLNEEEDASLFEAPSELVCPITHAVFLHPVLTQAGHVRVLIIFKPHLQISFETVAHSRSSHLFFLFIFAGI
jgi:hypothetical protein